MRPQQQNRNQRQPREAREFEEKVVQVSRVSKKTKGGNKMGFSVLMVVGDRQGKVGVGLGKAKDVLSAIHKGVRKAKKRMIKVPMNGTTIPFPVEVKRGAARIMLKPAPRGSGVIAGGPVRAVVEAAGIRDISSKILGTTNKASNVYATFFALQEIFQLVAVKDIKLKSIAEEEEEGRQKEREQQRAAQEKAAATEEKEAKPKAKKAVIKKAEAKVEAKAEEVVAAKKAPAKKAPAKKAAKTEKAE